MHGLLSFFLFFDSKLVYNKLKYGLWFTLSEYFIFASILVENFNFTVFSKSVLPFNVYKYFYYGYLSFLINFRIFSLEENLETWFYYLS